MKVNSIEEMRALIVDCRQVIRYHRDQKGDDRCWFDDFLVWKKISGSPSVPTSLSFEEGMEKCREFYEFRNASIPDSRLPESVLDQAQWDKGLEKMTQLELRQELARIHQVIRQHRDINGRHRNTDDDRALYNILPEKIPADFRLPSRDAFLGDAKAPHAGCPSFFRSHAACSKRCHDFHKWGAC